MRSKDFDERLKEHAETLLKIGIPSRFTSCLAISIRQELLDLDRDLLRSKFPMLYPDAHSIYEQMVDNWEFAVRNHKQIYLDIPTNRTAVIATNYLYFVYTKDTLLQSIKQVSAKNGPYRAICEFLCGKDVSRLRNALSHGTWRYTGNEDLQTLEYKDVFEDKNTVYTIEPQELGVWHLLSRTLIGYWSAFIADLRQPLEDQK